MKNTHSIVILQERYSNELNSFLCYKWIFVLSCCWWCFFLLWV